jgi:hypothetical protein
MKVGSSWVNSATVATSYPPTSLWRIECYGTASPFQQLMLPMRCYGSRPAADVCFRQTDSSLQKRLPVASTDKERRISLSVRELTPFATNPFRKLPGHFPFFGQASATILSRARCKRLRCVSAMNVQSAAPGIAPPTYLRTQMTTSRPCAGFPFSETPGHNGRMTYPPCWPATMGGDAPTILAVGGIHLVHQTGFARSVRSQDKYGFTNFHLKS